MSQTIRIATRKSPLALWQAEHVAAELKRVHPQLQVEIHGMTTQGDKILDTPLAKIGGKGLFIKELEQGLLSDQADIAVHSMKDVPVELPEGLHLAVIMQREDPRDAFVSNRYGHLQPAAPVPAGGTSSRPADPLPARQRQHPPAQARRRRVRRHHPGRRRADPARFSGAYHRPDRSGAEPARHRPGGGRHRVPPR